MGTEIIYPIGEQSFENLRNGGALYVDKTELIAIGVSFSRAERGIQEWKVARG